MPSLAAPLKKWIAQCKAYAAKHGCSYKEAMTALKKSRKASHRGGGVADNAAAVGGAEGFENPAPPAPPAPPAGTHVGAPPPAGAHTAGPTQPQSGGQSMFEAGAPAQSQSQDGGKRRRKLSKRKRGQNQNRSRSQSQSQQGGRRRSRSRSRSRGRRQTKRGGSPLSYSAY